jgi:putative ABC transport system permease protein
MFLSLKSNEWYCRISHFHIDIQWWMFVAAGAVAVAIAFLTVGFQSVRAALANPVKSLRSE